jgi:hypothetical protein
MVKGWKTQAELGRKLKPFTDQYGYTSILTFKNRLSMSTISETSPRAFKVISTALERNEGLKEYLLEARQAAEKAVMKFMHGDDTGAHATFHTSLLDSN